MNRINKNNFLYSGFFPQRSISLILFICFFSGCESRSDLKTDSYSNRNRSSEGEVIKEIAVKHKEPKLVEDTIIYERPQEQGGFLSAPDDVHMLLWGNKSDRPVSSADSNVVLVSFIIEPDSTASSVKILKGINAKDDSIAIYSVKKAKWQPGRVNGKPVRSRFAFPIVF